MAPRAHGVLRLSVTLMREVCLTRVALQAVESGWFEQAEMESAGTRQCPLMPPGATWCYLVSDDGRRNMQQAMMHKRIDAHKKRAV